MVEACAARPRAVNELIDGACERHAVTRELLLSRRRFRPLTQVRRELAVSLRARGMSFPLIGRYLQLDHASVIYLLKGRTRSVPDYEIPAQDLSGEWAI